MNFIKSTLAGVIAAASFVATKADAASLVTFGDPWGQKSDTIDQSMDDAFGVGGWTDVVSPVGTAFLAGESFAYIEGGSTTANEMESFLNANATALLSFLNAGGALFINAAPNEGDGLSFGGMSINYGPGPYCGSGCDAVDPANPIFAGAGTSFGGTSFSHATISGGDSLIEDSSSGDSLLSQMAVGNGFLMMGGMTTVNFHSGTDPAQLRANILAYAAAGGVAVNPAAVPLPAAGWMLIAGMGGLAAMRRRKAA